MATRRSSLILAAAAALLAAGLVAAVRADDPAPNIPQARTSIPAQASVPAQVAPGTLAVQSRLDRSLQNMLDVVLGPGTSTVSTVVQLGPAPPGPDGEEVLMEDLAGPDPDNAQTRNNAVNQVDEIRSPAPGWITRLDVTVQLFPTAGRPFDEAEVLRMVSAAAGIDPARGDTVTVSVLPRG